MSHSLPATAENVGRLRRAAAEFARGHGASERALESVNLAVSEALTNARPGLVLRMAFALAPALTREV